MEKLVADLSARIKSLEKESIHPPKEAQESRAIANCAILECATSANPAPTPREPKVVFPDKFDGSRPSPSRFPQSARTHFPNSTTHLQLRAIENCNSRNSFIRKEPSFGTSQWSSTRWPLLYTLVLGSFKKDMINTFCIADQTQESISKIRVLGQGSQHALRTVPHSAS
ncbi:hypothetical protein BASA83_005937 [Batrachochytrium salamandrivorans]|nr:hypothetical protein BASA83_005937 [Batrachochytrium salamandrivorans]